MVITGSYSQQLSRSLLGFVVVAALCSFQAVMAKEPAKVEWKYSADSLRPFWAGKVTEGESVLFIKDAATKQASAKLLFPVDKVIKVTNSAGTVTYEEGKDYTWSAGSREIMLPEGSRITSKLPEELRRPAKSQRHQLTHRDGNGEIFFGGLLEYAEMQTCITYAHPEKLWKGVTPRFDKNALPRTIGQLERHEPITILVIGDSISTGCNASGWANGAPFQPAYPDLLCQYLEHHYQSKVTLSNISVGGKDTNWATTMIDDIVKPKPDLVLIAFGMNDSAGRPAKEYRAFTEKVITQVKERLPDAEFVLVASMLGNRDWIRLNHDLFPQYRDELKSLCGKGISLADLTSVWDEMLKLKQDWDLTGNGVNHPNDFGHRVYAQVIATLLVPSP